MKGQSWRIKAGRAKRGMVNTKTGMAHLCQIIIIAFLVSKDIITSNRKKCAYCELSLQMQTSPQWAASFVVSLENQELSGLSFRATFTYIVKGAAKD